MPHKIFLLVSVTILTQKFVIKKNLSKIPALSFSFDWGIIYLGFWSLFKILFRAWENATTKLFFNFCHFWICHTCNFGWSIFVNPNCTSKHWIYHGSGILQVLLYIPVIVLLYIPNFKLSFWTLIFTNNLECIHLV